MKKQSIIFFKATVYFLLCLSFIIISCESDDSNDSEPMGQNDDDGNSNNDDDDGTGNTFQTIPQDKINQEFFIEGIYVTSPGRDRPKTVPHSIRVPSLEKPFIQERTGINIDEATFITIIGQRLAAENVSSSEDITRISRTGESYDSSVIMLAITDEVEPNASITTQTEITRVSAGNDTNGQSNSIITNGEFEITRINTDLDVLGETSNNESIESVRFIANDDAFTTDHDGTTVALYDGTQTQMTFSEFLTTIFSISEEESIAVIRTVTGISGAKEQFSFYGLPN